MRNILKYLAILSLSAPLILHINSLYSQSCLQTIEAATTYYEKGQLKEAIAKCSECTANKDPLLEWKLQRILTLCYLANNQIDSAKSSAYQMLNINPIFKPNVLNDPEEFIKLMKSFTVIPKFSVGLTMAVGTNITIPKIDDIYTITTGEKEYKGLGGYQFGASTAFQINRSFAIDASVLAFSKSYSIDYSQNNWKLNMDEKLTYMNLPFRIKYLLPTKSRIRPFINTGGYTSILLYSNSSFYSVYTIDQDKNSLVNISSMQRRNPIEFGLTGGIGFSYQAGSGQLIADLQFNKSISNVVKQSARYNNQELLHTFHYIEDDFKLNNLLFSIGYHMYLNYRVLKI